MQASITIENPADALWSRLLFLVFGLLSLGLGLRGLVQLGDILIGNAPWPTHFVWGLLITILAISFGCVFTWVFFIPSKKVVIDATSQSVRAVYQFPFGLRREDAFALEDVNPPEMVWHKNSEYSDGGFWEMKLALPDGRVVTRSPETPNLAKQKIQIEAWQAEIQTMRH